MNSGIMIMISGDYDFCCGIMFWGFFCPIEFWVYFFVRLGLGLFFCPIEFWVYFFARLSFGFIFLSDWVLGLFFCPIGGWVYFFVRLSFGFIFLSDWVLGLFFCPIGFWVYFFVRLGVGFFLSKWGVFCSYCQNFFVHIGECNPSTNQISVWVFFCPRRKKKPGLFLRVSGWWHDVGKKNPTPNRTKK